MNSSCDRNQEPILKILKLYIKEKSLNFFEIGSGTGQHGLFFAKNCPLITWTFSDRQENHQHIKNNLNASQLKNVLGPLPFEVGIDPLPPVKFDCLFTANTMHIMPWKKVKTLTKAIGKSLESRTLVFIYGPFRYQGKHTAPSNQRFDDSLKAQNSSMGIRAFEDMVMSMSKNGFSLLHDHEMPAHNRLLVFES